MSHFLTPCTKLFARLRNKTWRPVVLGGASPWSSQRLKAVVTKDSHHGKQGVGG